MGTLLISPHSDDICMSSTHIINRGLLPEPLHLATVFSLSFHLAESTTRIKRASIPKIRKEEDCRFCHEIDAAYHELGFYDSHDTNVNTFYNARLDSGLERQLLQLLRRIQPTVVVCPMPGRLRAHTHHEAVFKVITAVISKKEDTTLYLVDDQPYSRIPLDEEIVCNGTNYIPRVIELSEVDLRRKIEMLKIYKSQMRDSYFQAIHNPAHGDDRMRYSESIWIPNNFISSVIENKI